MYERTGVVKYARKFLLRGRIYAGIGIIGIVQLSARRLAVRAVATQTAGTGGFRNLATPVLQVVDFRHDMKILSLINIS